MSMVGSPLSHQQTRLWSWRKNHLAGPTLCAIQIQGSLQRDRFNRAVERVIERHEILHTVFYTLPGMDVPMQVVSGDYSWLGTDISLEHLEISHQLSKIDELFHALRRDAGDLYHGPLFHLWLFRFAVDRYILIVSLPALCADSRSMNLFLDELAKAYAEEALVEDILQYADVSAWQEELLQQEAAELERQYWRKTDLSQVNSLHLPFEREEHRAEKADDDSFIPHMVEVSLSRDLQQQVKMCAQQYDVSYSAFFLACWQVFLWCLSGDSNFIVGVACDGRVHEELKNALGLYQRFFPINAYFEDDRSFELVLALVNTSLQEAIERQGYFIWDEKNSSIGDAVAPFFPISFEYDTWSTPFDASELTFSLFKRWSCTEPFVLKLSVLQEEKHVQVEVQYDQQFLSFEQVSRLAEIFHTLLQNIVEQPHISVGTVMLLTGSEQEDLLTTLHGPTRSWSAQGLHFFFEKQVQRTPDQLATISTREQFTYRQLNEQANRLARVLRNHGVGPQVVVGLCLERQAQMLVGLLGILKGRGIYLPLDPTTPQARMTHQLQESGTQILVTQRGIDLHIPDWGGETLYFEDLEAELAHASAENLLLESDANDLAYVIYTSGSTGMPKGAMIRQSSVVNYTLALCERLDAEPGWQYATVSTLAADLGNTAIFCALASGGCVQVLDYETVTSTELLARWSERHPIDVLKIVPSHLSALLTGEQAKALLPRQVLVLGGEALPMSLLAQLQELGGTCQVYNHYGPTETTVGVLVKPLGVLDETSEERREWKRVPLGRPIANTEIYLVDQRMQLVPVGGIGELYLGGDGLAMGYIHQPEQTAERFVPHPWSAQPGARLYRTGDLARYSDEGEIAFVGRGDRQVKLRGYRIEVAEIEAAISRHPHVRTAVVMLRGEGAGEPSLVSYIVAQQQMGITSHLIREFLHQSLPEYMIPAHFFQIEALPLTANGKIDWQKLPLLEPEGEREQSLVMGPGGPIEEIVGEIWKDLLEIPVIGTHENFFAIGGHSLLATRVIAHIQTVLQIALPVQVLFEAPTVAELAHRVEQTLRQSEGIELLPLVARERPDVLPLSFAQQRLWFLDQLEPGGITYLLPSALLIKGEIDVHVLDHVLEELTSRHENLRTTFVKRDGHPMQMIHPASTFILPVIDLHDLGREQAEAYAHRLASQEAQHPCDLTTGPLMRIALLRLASEAHVLLLTLHHIITDGWSNEVLVQEFTVLYQAFVDGQPSPFALLPIQYADYALWQREWLQGEVLEAQLTYWRTQLAEAALLALPTDYPRPSVPTYQGANQPFQLSATLSEQLVTLSQQHNVTLFMLLLAAFQVLLARYSGQHDISVGAPIANRRHTELERVIGFFANTLVLRTDLSGDPTFVQVLERVREVCLGAYAHQDLPFEKVVEELAPQRNLERIPLFQVQLILQQILQKQSHVTHLDFELLEIEGSISRIDLVLAITETEQGLDGFLMYSTDLFEAETIERLLCHWQVLLHSIVHTPQASLWELPLLSQQERDLLLFDWNTTQHVSREEQCVHELFEQQVQHTPEAVALVCEEQQLTYAQLNRRANQLAHHLQALGVGPEVLVGLCMERSLELIIGVLGVLKAGGAYVPLDPTYPKARQAFLIQDAGLMLLLTQQHVVEHIPPSSARVIVLEKVWATLECLPEHSPESVRSVEHLAYVIYTSGSTGVPKGVQVPHRGVGILGQAQTQIFGVRSGSRVLQFASINFDASVSELVMALLSGASLHLARAERLLPGPDLLHILREQAISMLTLPPSALAVLAAKPLPDLQTLVVAGEVCRVEVMEQWSQGRHFFNAYGPTEVTVCATVGECVSESGVAQGSLHLGKPLGATQVYVLDPSLYPVPIGGAGEICLGGDGLARGYLNRCDQTAERFVPHPFSQEPGARVYRTGDLARYRVDGSLEYLGRMDQQVKIRGYRIELGEIEAVVQAHPGVQDVVLLAREDLPGDQRLIAYVVLYPGETHLDEDLRRYLEDRLPGYMVPTAWVFLDGLPLTINGKIDRQALPTPEEVQEERYDLEEARTPVEELLLGLWCEILGYTQIGIGDNFFDLGGHSLLVTQLVARIRAILGVEVPTRAVFETPTVAGFAQRVDEALRQGEALLMPPLVTGERPDVLPLSFAQHRLWFLDQLEPESAAYLISSALRIDGILDEHALERALEALIERHESLRTTFEERDEQPRQVIHPAGSYTVPIIDLHGLGSEQATVHAQWLASQEIQHPCDLVQGPLLRTTLLHLGEKRHVLLLTLHHIITDGWSNGVLVQELTTLYQAAVVGESSLLAPVPIQYADYALWQRSWLQGEVLDAQVDYWRTQLAGSSPFELPTDHSRPAVQTFRGASQSFELPAGLSEQLVTLSRQEHVTLFMLLLAAFQVLLARYSGQDDISVGTPVANRRQIELEGVIGFFVNTLVLRTDLSGDPTFQQVLQRVREGCLGAYAHQDVPFEKVVEELAPQRDLSRSPLFQIMLVLQNTPSAQANLAELSIDTLDVESSVSKFDLSLSLTETEQGLVGALEYNTDLFEAETIERLLRHWHVLLEGIVQNPQAHLWELPLLSPQEHHLQLIDWNPTSGTSPEDCCVHELFEQQVQRTPRAIALVFEEQQLTYDHLNGRANLLARYLQQVRVGPEVLVGLCMERSLEMVIGVLGVLKAGGVYVPLDPASPQKRLTMLLENLAVTIVLTKEQHLNVLSRSTLQCICLDLDWPEMTQESKENLSCRISLDNLAYIISTSGSTGSAKGVQISHCNVVHSTLARHTFYEEVLTSYLLLSPLTFDSSVAGIFWTLSAGGALHISSDDLVNDLLMIPEYIERYQISHFLSIPSLYAHYLEQAKREQLMGLRTVIVAGEACPPSLVESHNDLFPEIVLFNEYGPTEGTVWSSVYRVLQETNGRIPIGRAREGMQMYLLDQDQCLVPIGVMGELYLGGPSIARGYRDAAELTAEKFVPHLLSERAGERLYRTGDLARFRQDGNLEFLGRIDTQVKVRGYRIELGEIEVVLGGHPAIREGVVLLREERPGEKRLVAYVVGEPGEQLESAEVRSYLRERLPTYMLPSAMVVVEAFPLTVNGKLDRRALPAPPLGSYADEGFLAPRTVIEKTLATIWAEVLHTGEIGIHENFFERGGDSIIAIQIIAHARQQGLQLTLKQLFQYQTIAQLSSVVAPGMLVQAEQGLVQGSMPLTPIQHWFFDQDLMVPHHWNQSVFLKLGQAVQGSRLEQVVHSWLRQHDALRLRFHHTHDGWHASYGALEGTPSYCQVDLSALANAEQDIVATRLAEQTQASLDLEQGLLLRVVVFERGKEQHSLLLLVVHHLVVDGVSWRILLDDLQVAFQQLEQGQEIVLPAKTSSFKAWAEHLRDYASSTLMQQEHSYWLGRNLQGIVPLPRDFPQEEAATLEISAEVSTALLSIEETRALLEEVPALYHTQINEVLLTALAQVLTGWMGSSGVLIELEGHGREDLFVDVDLSRTVGWFTTVFPLFLNVAGCGHLEEVMRAVKEQVRAIPNHGIGYGVLRYLSPDPALVEAFSAQPQPEVLFNYLGQVDRGRGSSTEDVGDTQGSSLIAGFAQLSSGPSRSEQEKQTHAFEINCLVSGNQFQVTWTYSRQVYRPATIGGLIEGFIQALRQIIGQSQSVAESMLTPSDFPTASLTQDQLEHLLREWKSVETITALSSAQEGMLYETLRGAESGIHIEQSMYTLTGSLDVDVFERAWQWGVEQHAMLRTGFVWGAYAEPLQITLRRLPIHVQYQDWRGIVPQERQTQVETFLRDERMRGFDLSQPPLMRLALLHLEDQRYHFVWTAHHILMDGWSEQILLRQVIACYRALSQGNTFHAEASRPYSDYIVWLKQQDIARAEQFWRGILQGIEKPTALGHEVKEARTIEAEERYGTQIVHLSVEGTRAVTLITQRQRLTLSTLIQGVWAILLNRYSGNQDVVFGITVSGRPAELEGVETMVGLCINTLPLHVQLPVQVSLWNWFEGLQQHMVEMHSYEYTPAGQVHQWSEVPATAPMYESLLVVENYPTDAAPSEEHTVFQEKEREVSVVDMVAKGAQTKYALTLLVSAGANLSIQCIYDGTRFERSAIEHILHHFKCILEAIASGAEESLANLSTLIPVEEIPTVYAVHVEEELQERRVQGPRSPIEELVASMWCEILGVEHVDLHHNFFELGGHSLLVTQLIARIRAILEIEVSLRIVFEEPTVAGLARVIEQLLRQDKTLSYPLLVAGERPERVPLSFAQQRLWFLDQLEPESTAYLIPNALRIDGMLDEHALERALEALIDRHESLRTTFEQRDDQPVQVIHPAGSCILPVIDLYGLGQEQAEEQARRLTQQEVLRPCNLVWGPLLRSTLLRLQENGHVLLLTLHHIITDGWSNSVLVQELTTLYQAVVTGEPSPLTPLPIQYADYALWQREWLQGAMLEKLLLYWKSQLRAPLPVLLFPTNYRRILTQKKQGAIRFFKLSASSSNGLRALGQQEGVTLFMTLFAAFNVLLHYFTGQDDFVVGTDIANRNQVVTEGLIGFFVNQLVLRTNLAHNPSFLEIVHRVRDVSLKAYTYQDLPFDRLVEALNPERDLSHTPLFQVKFVLQNTPVQKVAFSDLKVEPVEFERGAAKFDLLFNLSEDGQEIQGSLEYRTDLFNAETIIKFLRYFEIIICHVVAFPETRLDEMKEVLIAADEEEKLTEEKELQLVSMQKLRKTRRKTKIGMDQ